MLNWSTGKSLFKIIYTSPQRFALDLVSLPKVPRLSTIAKTMAKRFQEVQAEVSSNLKKANMKYKQAEDKHRRARVF